MKTKASFLLGALCLAGTVLAQPVIPNGSNFPAPGSFNAPVSIGTFSGTIPGGAGQTWDFSAQALTQVGNVSSVPVSSTPFADTFPQATHVLPIVFSIGQPTSYQYFKVSNDKLEMVASYAGAGISGSKDYTPNLKTQMIFPFSYGDTTSDTYQKVGYSPDVVGLKYYGYGTLIMPDRTYNDVVLIKNSYGSDNDYAWVTLNPLVPVLNYTYDNNQLIYIGAVPTSVEDRNAHAAYRVYPNPAQGHIMASLPTGQAGKDVQFSLTNAFGQTILQAPLRQETTSIDASHLAPGIYFYTIATGGQPVAAGKLCIR